MPREKGTKKTRVSWSLPEEELKLVAEIQHLHRGSAEVDVVGRAIRLLHRFETKLLSKDQEFFVRNKSDGSMTQVEFIF